MEGWWTTLNLPAEKIIALYQDHGTSEQFHSELKTDMDLERLPSGKFEVNSLVMSAYERAKAVLTEHIDVLHKLAEQLLEKETILGAEMDEIIRQVRPGIELPEKPGDKEEPAGDKAPPEPTADANEENAAEAPDEPPRETDTTGKEADPQ